MKQAPHIWIVFFLVVSGVFSVNNAAAQDKYDSIPRLTLHAEASIHVPADQVELNIGVVTSEATVDEALEQNTAKMTRVENALKKIGMTAAEYRTGHFQIQPKWSPRPRQSDSDWRPHIVGYTVSNTLRVKSLKINRIGKIIEVSSQAGANQIGTIVFNLADPRKFRSNALAAAIDNAEADARSLTNAAGVKLGPILFLELERAAEIPRQLRHTGLREAATGTSVPLIIPGDVTLNASVKVVYRIISGK